MTWTKIDRAIRDDPRLVQLPRGTRLLHVEALTWCNDWGKDGAIPRWALPKISDEPNPEAAAEQLVGAQMWDATADGWIITDFLNDQPSADDVDRIKAANLQRQHRQRQHKAGDHSACNPKYCHQASRVTGSVTDAVSHNTPYRTVPTRRGGTGTGLSRPASGADAPTASEPPHEWGSGVHSYIDENGDMIFQGSNR